MNKFEARRKIAITLDPKETKALLTLDLSGLSKKRIARLVEQGVIHTENSLKVTPHGETLLRWTRMRTPIWRRWVELGL